METKELISELEATGDYKVVKKLYPQEPYKEDSIDMDKIKAQFKEMTNRAIRDFDQDMRTFPPEMDSDRVIERRYYSR